MTNFHTTIQLSESYAQAAAKLMAKADFNVGLPVEELYAAVIGSSAWAGIIDDQGTLLGTARAISDGIKWAWIYDVYLDVEFQGLGLGRKLILALLDHPKVRNCRVVRLSTKDKQTFYRKTGFILTSEAPQRPWQSVEMVTFRGLLPHMPGFEGSLLK